MKLKPGYKVVLDTGHPDLVFNVYSPLTKGKQYTHKGAKTFHEGHWNRWFANLLMHELYLRHIPYNHISPELIDTPLNIRKKRINKMYKIDKEIYLFSIHFNAGNGRGSEIYTTKGLTKSDYIAEYIISKVEKELGDITHLRYDKSDGDKDKEKNFSILMCNPFAVLLEILFFDNLKDFKQITDPNYFKKYVKVIADAIEEIYLYGIE